MISTQLPQLTHASRNARWFFKSFAPERRRTSENRMPRCQRSLTTIGKWFPSGPTWESAGGEVNHVLCEEDPVYFRSAKKTTVFGLLIQNNDLATVSRQSGFDLEVFDPLAWGEEVWRCICTEVPSCQGQTELQRSGDEHKRVDWVTGFRSVWISSSLSVLLIVSTADLRQQWAAFGRATVHACANPFLLGNPTCGRFRSKI